MAELRIPEYGTWEDEGTHGFTIQFAKGRTFKYGGPIMNQDMLPTKPEVADAKTDSSEPPMDQDLGSTPPPETRQDSEARKAREGVPPKANKINPHNGGRVVSSGDAFTNPQGKKLDGLSVKKSPLNPRVEAKVRSWRNQCKTPQDGGPNVTPPVPPFGVWDKSENFSDIFKKNQRGNVDVIDNPEIPDPLRRPTKKPEKGGCCKWICGSFYL